MQERVHKLMHEKKRPSGRGGGLPLGGVDGVVERLAPKSGAFPLWQCSLTFCLSGFRPHEMLQIEVSMLQNCLKKWKSSVELC